MRDINFLIWHFPLLFIFHDFEEIIFMKPWIIRSEKSLTIKFPKLSTKILPHLSSLTTSSFSLGVAEEFVLISIITIASYLTGWYYVWIGTFIAFTFHLIIHCIQGIAFRGYVPALVTSVICLPACFYILTLFLQLNPLVMTRVALFSVIGIVIMIINLQVIHIGMTAFDRWLLKYQSIR